MKPFFSELAGHDRRGFTSGNERIDAYFHNTIGQDVKRNYALCYVLVERATDRIAGFYTLSSSNIPLTDMPAESIQKLPRYPTVPAVLIGWFGRDLGFRGQNIGSMLLHDVIARVVGSPVGAYALCADAVDDEAAAFYRKHLFTPFESRPRSLFLPMRTARELIEGK